MECILCYIIKIYMDMDFIQIHIHMDFNEQIKKKWTGIAGFQFQKYIQNIIIMIR